MSTQHHLDSTDPRISHLQKNPRISFAGDKLVNHWSDISKILMPTGTTTSRVYCFDGELDDQLRLENVLHHSSKDDRLIVVAGVRVDGEQTWEEMVQVIRRVLRTEVSKDGNVAGWPQLRLVNGGPLLVKDQKQKFLLTLAVEELKDILGNQQFVIHSNTSATYVEAVLMDPDLVQQVKAVTFTCALVTPPDTVLMGCNASWNLDAYFHCLEICERLSIVFVSFHGSLSAWQKTTLPELEGWSDALLLPVATMKEKDHFRKIVTFSYAMVLSWLGTAYARATGKDRQAVLKLMEPWLGEDGKLARADPQSFDAKWLTLVDENLTEADFSEKDQSGIHRRFGAVAINLGFAYSNTIGDVSGCVADMPTSNEDVVAMPVRITGERWNWKAVIGDDSEQPSNHYAVVWAREEQTLDKAWSAIKTGRFAHPVEDGIPPVDEAMKEGWRAFAELARLMLDGIWEGRNKFPEESLILLDRARHNVKYGPWTEYCRNPIERGSTVADDPVIDWCDTGADDPKIDEDECSEYDVLCSVEVE